MPMQAAAAAGVTAPLPTPVRLEHHLDPRRPGRAMVAVWCVCGRFYTVTGEAIAARNHGCPDADCGKGEQ